MPEVDHPRLFSACASTSSPLEIMGRGFFGLDGVRTASFEGVPLPLVDRLAWSTRASGVGNFSDRLWGVSRDPQQPVSTRL